VKPLEDIVTASDIFDWLEQTYISAVYESDYYNGDEINDDNDLFFVATYNR
jgi:hypothetical protein